MKLSSIILIGGLTFIIGLVIGFIVKSYIYSSADYYGYIPANPATVQKCIYKTKINPITNELEPLGGCIAPVR